MIFDIFRKSGGNRTLTPQQLEVLATGHYESGTGVTVSPETAARFGTVFACIRVRAESLGQLPLHFMEKQGRNKRPAVEHPLYTLLHDAPNEGMTAQEFWEFMSACLDLQGNAFAHIGRLPNGDVYELLPLLPQWVTVKMNAARDVYYEVRVPNTEPRAVTGRDLLHLRGVSLNGLTGASVIAHARETIGLAMAIERHGAKFFKNGGIPGGVLTTDQVLTDENVEDMEEAWADTHGGLENSHRIAILEAGLKFQNIGMPLRDAQFLEGRKFSRTEIAGLFRVPPHLIGDLERATFSNIEQQGLDFVVHGLMPSCIRVEQRIKLHLVAKPDRQRYFAKFNVNGLVRGDMAARAAYYKEMFNIGVYSPNDIRDREDDNPREGGDAYYTPMNMTVNGQPPKGEPK